MTDTYDRKALFSDRLKQACHAKYGRSHGAASYLAKEIDVSIQTASKWLRGVILPDESRWGVIANNLNVETAWLFGLTDVEPRSFVQTLPDETLDKAAEALEIVLPLIREYQPDLELDHVQDLFRSAVQQLRYGVTPDRIAGDTAARLLQFKRSPAQESR